MFCVCYIDHYKSNSINQSPTTTTTTTSDVLIKKKKKKFCHCLDICFLDQISIQNSLNFNKIWIKFVIKKKKILLFIIIIIQMMNQQIQWTKKKKLYHHHHQPNNNALFMIWKPANSSNSRDEKNLIFWLKIFNTIYSGREKKNTC